ncbi:MAG: hypothetical protein HYU63_03120 [Armatimonadetes bacterium]|nr:hypothetical protein [Armatimonadota bacterium]
MIFAHLKLNPTQSDRFYSDLGQWKKIKQPFIKKFTYFAENASIPIVLGGHSLVNGGLYILSELIGLDKSDSYVKKNVLN